MKTTAPRFYVLPSSGKYLVFDRKAPKGRWFTGIEADTRKDAEELAAEMNDPGLA